MGAPPAGPPWDLPIEQVPWAFVDLEMTGLDLENDRVVEVCIERWVGERCEARLETLVHPGARAGGNVRVHGIGSRELDGAPAFDAIAARASDLLDGAIFVAHAAEWDIRFLTREFARLGREHTIPFFIDTLTLSRRAFALPSHALDALRTHFGLTNEGAHRAGADVWALRHVFARCLEVLAPKSARDLWEVRVADRHAREAILESCAVALHERRPIALTYRPARRQPETYTFMVTEIQTDAEPPRVLGYSLPGRGRHEFRADRILRVERARPP